MMLIAFIPIIIVSVIRPAASTSTQKCNSVMLNRCVQKCNTDSCKCTRSDGKHAFTKCSQACEGPKCKKLVCSSGTCIQRCHGCKMECTKDVEYCGQQCLSGECSFKCSARRCFQECDGKKCDHLPSEKEEPFIPRLYLVILAGLFATTTILTCLALVMSCSHVQCWKRRTNRRTRPVVIVHREIERSIRTLPLRSEFV